MESKELTTELLFALKVSKTSDSVCASLINASSALSASSVRRARSNAIYSQLVLLYSASSVNQPQQSEEQYENLYLCPEHTVLLLLSVSLTMLAFFPLEFFLPF